MKEELNKWHLLSPQNYDKVFNILSSQYPKLFIKEKVFILKKRLHQDIFNNRFLNLSRTIIRKFLTIYSRQIKYREIHIENVPRYNLEGKIVGVVTKEDVEFIHKNSCQKKNGRIFNKNKGCKSIATNKVEYKTYDRTNLKNVKLKIIRKKEYHY